MVNNIGLLWAGSAILPLITINHWQRGGKQAGTYMLYLSGIASTYTIGMTLRHFEIGFLVVRDHLPDLGFVAWQSLVFSVFLSAILAMRRPQARYSFIYELRLLGITGAVILVVTLIDEFTSSFHWVDLAAFFIGVSLAALPLLWILQEPPPGST